MMNYNAIASFTLVAGKVDYVANFNTPFIPKYIELTRISVFSSLGTSPANDPKKIFAVYMAPAIGEPIAEVMIDGESHSTECRDIILNVTNNFNMTARFRILSAFEEANPTIGANTAAKIVLHFKFTA